MSFFDRLSNLGRGTIKNAFSGDEASPADPLARELEKLHRAYTSGIHPDHASRGSRTRCARRGQLARQRTGQAHPVGRGQRRAP